MDWIVDRLKLLFFGAIASCHLTSISFFNGWREFAQVLALISFPLLVISVFGMALVLIVLRVERRKLDKEIEEILGDE